MTLMNAITRRSMLGAAASALVIRHARAAEFTFKVGTDIPDAAPLNIYLKQAAIAIARESGGRVDLQIFANNVLGGAPAMFSQLRTGALECFLNSGINSLSSLIPRASIYGLGFIFDGDNVVYDALDGDLGLALRKQITDANLIVMDRIWANGFRQITSSTKPIHAVKDLDGFKIRVPVSNMWVSNFKSLGASPTSLPFQDVYTALQTHVVDGQETPLSLISTAKLYEVQRYCAKSNHMWDGYWCLFAPSAWDALPDDLKAIIARNLDDAALKQRVATASENDRLEQELAAQGLLFNHVDRAEFREKLRTSGYYAQWHKTFGDELWGLLEKYTGKLA